MLAALALSFRIPIIQTKSPRDSAALLFLIARREQDPTSAPVAQHRGKPASLAQMQEYLVSALPGIGPVLCVPLLAHFSSIQALASASLPQLQQVDLIGEKKAKAIHDVLHQPYRAQDDASLPRQGDATQAKSAISPGERMEEEKKE
jgi:ERCC4-type nuclease